MIGLDPRPFTYRELEAMEEGRLRAMWRVQSEVMATIANVSPHVKDPVQSAEFDPFRRAALKKAGIEVLRTVFVREARNGKSQANRD